MTLNVAVATCPPTSVAVTVDVVVPLGTLNVQLNDPVPPVESEPLVHFVIDTPSKTSDFRVVDTEKPVPYTVTVAPTGPLAELKVSWGVVTVNLPVAFCPPTSVAVTVVPTVPLGTFSTQANNPRALVVNEPLVQLEVVTPSKTSPTGLDTEKPAPATCTVAPTGPWLGTTAITGIVTTKSVVASWPPTSVALTTSVVVPAGTLRVHEKAPPAPVVREDPPVQLEAGIATPSKFSPTGLLTEKPVPATVTVAPIGPSPGTTVTLGVVTRNAYAAVRVLVAVFSPTTE